MLKAGLPACRLPARFLTGLSVKLTSEFHELLSSFSSQTTIFFIEGKIWPHAVTHGLCSLCSVETVSDLSGQQLTESMLGFLEKLYSGFSHHQMKNGLPWEQATELLALPLELDQAHRLPTGC